MFAQSLKALRKKRGLTQYALARCLGLTQQAVAKWEAGSASPDPEMLIKLARALHVETEILLGFSDGTSWDQRLPSAAGLRPYIPGEHKLVPVLGVVRAGYGLPAEEEDLGLEPANVRDPSRYFYLIVQGDSMEPRIRDGDLALVRKQPTLEDGDLGVVVYGDGEGTLKRFHRKGGAIALQAFNPAYETLILAGDELEQLYIIGKVVETKARW